MVKNKASDNLPSGKDQYYLNDMSGAFIVENEYGIIKSKKQFVLKSKMYQQASPEKILEQRISITTPGVLSKKVNILRPEVSQNIVWLEGKKYSVKTNINSKKRSIDVTLKSPESKWNGVKSYPFPNGTGVYCYFSQLIECINFTGFVHKSKKAQAGKMSFHVLWDGYPFFNEQYPSLPSKLFSKATFAYDGTEGDLVKYTLEVEGQALFYQLNKDTNRLEKLFWVTQGFSMIKKK